MSEKSLITFIIGTRPEAIKLSPIINIFSKSDKYKVRVILTGQHKDMVNDVLQLFDIKVDLNLNIMLPNQTLNYLISKTISELSPELISNKPDILMVQGDTSSAFASALTAFNLNILVAHVEAGLRTDDIKEPFPEEVNRRLISQLATLHFAPTKRAYENLISSKVAGKIFITGNSVIDAINSEVLKFHLPEIIEGKNLDKYKIILTTIHRRENWGINIENICKAILKIIEKNKYAFFIIPLHKNKIVRDTIIKLLKNNKRILLTEPLNYRDLVAIMKKSYFILTDSGGIQEEAPSFKKPILVLRNKTERQEIIENGIGKLVGTNIEKIVDESINLLTSKKNYSIMSNSGNPFGDGRTSEMILEICGNLLNKKI